MSWRFCIVVAALAGLALFLPAVLAAMLLAALGAVYIVVGNARRNKSGGDDTGDA